MSYYIEGNYNPRVEVHTFDSDGELEQRLILAPSSAPLTLVPDHIDESEYVENINRELVRVGPPVYRARYRVEWYNLSAADQKIFFQIIQRQMTASERILFYPFYNAAMGVDELTVYESLITKKWYSFDTRVPVMGFEFTARQLSSKMINEQWLDGVTQFGNVSPGRTAILT